MTEKETQYPVSQLGPTTVKERKFLMERYLKAKDVWKVIEHATKIRKEQKVDEHPTEHQTVVPTIPPRRSTPISLPNSPGPVGSQTEIYILATQHSPVSPAKAPPLKRQRLPPIVPLDSQTGEPLYSQPLMQPIYYDNE
ncbi:uncharacterized protein MCYG_01847 [Microsporum canis CBS 113480]|uniref:Uncharacterized protein n=1 Tax=Arthroderma otae (strain ATCC MYA-4605 / CBS 113480) TaxID=554155 RepID=C5FI48_ARTOC|nr:uncharacterized protein MCYG_01847 [Microsporum canis CBS 113480]EEQ29028.1 predicted protein [Microsporum canis CBS 113480]